jgi:hypothetical protein
VDAKIGDSIQTVEMKLLKAVKLYNLFVVYLTTLSVAQTNSVA